MRKDIVFMIILLCLIFYQHSVLGENNADEEEIRKLLGEAYIMTEDYESAEAEYRRAIEDDPRNIAARIGLADILSWQRKYDESTAEYKKVLEIEPDNLEAKKKLADVMSWDKRYIEAVELYDEVLSEKEDVEVRLQKAHILGWTRKYSESLEEYKKILDIKHDEPIELEMNAKKAYWNNRVKHAILCYKQLIEKDGQNVEAMFDLSQIYCYQSMWKDAIREFERILETTPLHFRANDGLKKADLMSKHISLESGYEFFEADSQDRINDIKRHTFFNRLLFPINYNIQIKTGYNLTNRSFSDFGDVLENEGRVGFTYLERPDWWINGFYNFIEYNKGIDTMHTFGADLNLRIFDIGVSSFSFERERLENSSKVIREGFYRDTYKGRLDFDVNRRLKLGTDYLYSNYSNDNYKNELGTDMLFYLSFDPTRLTINYRYFFRDFDRTADEYFSPRDFSTHKITINWRHFLNKEEIYFGADDLYYDLKYDISVDSGDIVSHKFSAEFNWDITKKLQFNIKGSITNSSADVYEDKSAVAAIKYYF